MTYTLYLPSGRVPLLSVPLAAACLAVIVPAAIGYAWLQLQVPAVLGFFVACLFALFMASGVKRVCALGKVRHPGWMGWAGILVGLGGWYVQWAAWATLHAGSHDLAGVLHMAIHPAEVAGHALDAVWPAQGGARYLVAASWLGEFWMLLFFPHYMGKMRAEEVFDEAAGAWARYEELPNKFKPVGQPDLLRVFSERGQTLAHILHVEADEASTQFARLRVYRLAGNEQLVSIVNVEVKGKEGAEKIVESWPGKYLYVPTPELDQLLATTAGTAEVDPPELAEAIERLQAGDAEAAFQAALPFIAADEQCLYCDANRICALACSQLERWTQALAYWQALFSKEATAHNALQVATSAVMANEPAHGAAWAETAHTINKSSREMPSISIITGMLSALSRAGLHGNAMPFLEELKSIYTQLQVTDPTVLFAHRMPLFHVFLEKSTPIVTDVLGAQGGRGWFSSMLPHLDERGKAELTAWLARENAPA